MDRLHRSGAPGMRRSGRRGRGAGGLVRGRGSGAEGRAGSAWRSVGYDDGAWKSGRAQLGYGDGDEATVVGYGPSSSSRYMTTYFRASFTVADPSQVEELVLELLRDDGAVVYLNGTE